jgi:integrase
MGVFERKDSPWWWLWLETSRRKERTDIRLGTTTAQRHDSRKLAEERYHQRMNELAARLYRLPSAQPAIRFAKYAETYETTIALHRGAERERRLLLPLVAFFGEDLLTTIDADHTRAYMRDRANAVAAVTVNREIDLLKAMLRDAVPKYLTESPIAGLKRLHTVKPKRRLLTVAEERRLLKVGDRQDRALLILGIDALIRLGDLLDLQRSDRRGPWLYVRDPKSGEPYEAALSPRAAKALDALGKKGTYYFPKFRVAKNARDWTSSVRQRFEALCEEADVVYGKSKGGITWHWATRRTGATRLIIAKRVPVSVVQQQGNWKSPDVLLQIYSEAQRDDLLKAVGHVFPARSRKSERRASSGRK